MADYREPVGSEKSWLVARLRRHVSELVRLSIPIIISRSGLVILITVDTIMVGHFSATELAYQSIGMALTLPVLLISMGMILGTIVLSANNFGNGTFEECGAVWRRAVPYATVLGLLALLFCLFGPFWLALSGQSEELAAGGGNVMRVLGWGLPAHLVFLASAFFLDGIRRPKPAMVLMIAANVLNAGLNWAFIYGEAGFPAGGAEGAAWATTVVRWFMAIGGIAYVWTMHDHEKFGVRIRPAGGWKTWSRLRVLGYGTGVAIGVETVSFAILNVFAGWLGEDALGAYSITLNLLALVFMFAIGVGSASAVRVGIAFGRRDFRDLALAGWTGLGVNTLAMLTAGTVFILFPEWLGGLYTSDENVLAVVTAPIRLCGLVMLADGGQAVMANVLRGRQDVWVPSGMQTISFFVVMIPIAWLLAFQAGHGVYGLIEAIFAGAVLSLTLLSVRFVYLTRSDDSGNPEQG